MLYRSKFFNSAHKILLILLIIFLLSILLPFLSPIYEFVKFLGSCMVFGVILYYLFRPLVDLLIGHKVPFFLTAAIVFLILALILIILSLYIIPIIIIPIQQVVASNTPQKAEEVKEATFGFLSSFNLYSYDEIRNMAADYVLRLQQYIFQNAFNIFSAITHIAAVLVLTPFILFYLLKDGHNFHEWFLEMIPFDYRMRIEKVLEQLDQILVGFFNGQITIAGIVTVLTFIGLHLIGMENTPFLTFITFFLSLIPYLGTLLSILPAIFQGLTESYWMAALGMGVMTLIHLTESNIITPQVMRKRFDIHPLTIILLIISSFYFFGLLGPLWITPAYVFLREILIEAYFFFELDEKA